MTTYDKILTLFEHSHELTIKSIVDILGISKQMVHLVIKRLMQEKVIERLGSAPKTIYRFRSSPLIREEPIAHFRPETEDRRFLAENFNLVTETGELLAGTEAFEYWCRRRGLPVYNTFREFRAIKQKYARHYNKQGLANGKGKLREMKRFSHIWLDKLYYLDIESIRRFGRTPLATLVHYGKQGQNKHLMELLLDSIGPRIIAFIQDRKFDAVGFVPPTVRRELQLMKYLQTQLNLPIPVVEIKKTGGPVHIPQLSLSKPEDRGHNADNSFAVTERRSFQHILLLDDVVGSGATLNRIAAKFKKRMIAESITGLAIVGSV